MGPEDLDDLLASIREEAKRESALALYEGTRKDDIVGDDVDERILRILGLEDVVDIDYDTYRILLRERMVADRMGGNLVTEEAELLSEEWKRVKSKVGRFKINSKKIDAESFGSNLSFQKKILSLPLSSTETEESSTSNIKAPKVVQSRKDPLVTISEKLSSIIEVIKKQNKFIRQQGGSQSKQRENERRSKRENELENEKEGKKANAVTSKVITPFKNLFDKIFNFLKWTFLGSTFFKLLKWLNDPENEKKVLFLNRFLADWWPALSAAALLFLTPLGFFIKGIIGTVAALSIRFGKYVIPPLLAFLKKHKKASAIAIPLAIASGVIIPKILQQRQKEEGPPSDEKFNVPASEEVDLEKLNPFSRRETNQGENQLENQSGQRENQLENQSVQRDETLGSFRLGGRVPGEGPYNLHKDELVMTAAQQQRQMNITGIDPALFVSSAQPITDFKDFNERSQRGQVIPNQVLRGKLRNISVTNFQTNSPFTSAKTTVGATIKPGLKIEETKIIVLPPITKTEGSDAGPGQSTTDELPQIRISSFSRTRSYILESLDLHDVLDGGD